MLNFEFKMFVSVSKGRFHNDSVMQLLQSVCCFAWSKGCISVLQSFGNNYGLKMNFTTKLSRYSTVSKWHKILFCGNSEVFCGDSEVSFLHAIHTISSQHEGYLGKKMDLLACVSIVHLWASFVTCLT